MSAGCGTSKTGCQVSIRWLLAIDWQSSPKTEQPVFPEATLVASDAQFFGFTQAILGGCKAR
jgi:hypothetical protein